MSFDADAQAYITAVESADGAALPSNIRRAINNFVVGCKADLIWASLKSACFLAGPATIAGALVPLVGTAPTNIGGNFVAGDHNQLTGLKGNGSTKALDSNRNNNADPQDNVHQSVWLTETVAAGVIASHIGAGGGGDAGATHIISDRSVFNWIAWRNRTSAFVTTNGVSGSTGFIAHSRNNSASYVTRLLGSNTTRTEASNAPYSANVYVFARNVGSVSLASSARIAWYSIGESIDLAALDSRLATYMTEIATPLAGLSTIIASHHAALGI